MMTGAKNTTAEACARGKLASPGIEGHVGHHQQRAAQKMRTRALGVKRHDPVTEQDRQQNRHANRSADKHQLMQGISATQHLDHGIHDRDAEHREQQIKNGFEVQVWLLVVLI